MIQEKTTIIVGFQLNKSYGIHKSNYKKIYAITMTNYFTIHASEIHTLYFLFLSSFSKQTFSDCLWICFRCTGSGIRLGLASKEVHSHYCQIDEISAILLKRSGKNYFLAEEVDSGNALKKVAGKYFFEFCREISKLLLIQELGILFF